MSNSSPNFIIDLQNQQSDIDKFSKENLKKLRNDIVGSYENKLEYMKDNSIKE